MADEKRKMSERSLENLKLGAESRRQGKVRHNFTILPETVQWLKCSGNASEAIDNLVFAALDQKLFSINTHDRIDKEQVLSNNTHDQKEEPSTVSNDVYEQKIKELNQSLEETYLELSTVRSQLAESQGENNFQETRWKLTNRMNNEFVEQRQKDKAKIVDLLKPALKFPGNNAAPIKAQIRAVLALLDDVPNLEA
jgi:regulator of replication initiation timing